MNAAQRQTEPVAEPTTPNEHLPPADDDMLVPSDGGADLMRIPDGGSRSPPLLDGGAGGDSITSNLAGQNAFADASAPELVAFEQEF